MAHNRSNAQIVNIMSQKYFQIDPACPDKNMAKAKMLGFFFLQATAVDRCAMHISK